MPPDLTLPSRAAAIRLIAFDVDGIMTDGGLFLSDSGKEFKRFNSLDGHGLKMLKASGVTPAIITGRNSRCVELRAKNLGIVHLFQGIENKLDTLRALLAQLNLTPQQAAFMGDDVVDLPAMLQAGLAITVPEAPQTVRDHAHYVTLRNGGHGAVREACELLMSAQGTLDAQLAPYLNGHDARPPDGTTSHSTKPASGQVAGYLPSPLPQTGEGDKVSLRELQIKQ